MLIIIVQLLFQLSASVFFTVELEKGKYYSEFGDEVQMACRFQPIPKDPSTSLQLSWHWIAPDTDREVYKLINGREYLPLAASHYQGRVSFSKTELSQGWTKLKLSALKINDSGTYQCLVESDSVGDYKEMTLSVTAPYKNVTKRIESTTKDHVQLTCESKGYPVSRIKWTDSEQQVVNASTSNEITTEQLIKVVSHVLVSSSQRNEYTCQFETGGNSKFLIPEDLHRDRVKYISVIIVIIFLLLVLAVTIMIIIRLKVGQKPQLDSTEESAAFHSEDLSKKLRNHYKQTLAETEDWMSVSYTIQNKEGQTVPLSSIVPKTGEKVLLDGPPGSGKTSVALVLVSYWMSDSTTLLDLNVLDLSNIHVLLYVDASKRERDLFESITSQLPTSEDELNSEMSKSTSLLVLDGYVEGNSEFDYSLTTFVEAHGDCSLLVMSCPDQCPNFKTTVQSKNMLTLEKL